MKRLGLLALALLVLTGCASTAEQRTEQSLNVAHASLKAVGTNYLQAASLFREGCEVSKTIKLADCASFRSFQEKFKKSYTPAIDAYEAAVNAKNSIDAGKARDAIAGLSSELSALALKVGLQFVPVQPTPKPK